MSEGQSAPDLRVLDDKYERLGELRGSDEARTYLAKRRDDGADVTITVVRAANGGENNALSHFASDARMLARVNHPNVARVLDGRWLGKDAFALVSKRVRGTSLAELLSSGERFPYPRVATVLQRVSGVLDWAREQGVVHRGVTADTLFFEQGTHRPVMTLALTPIPVEGVPDGAADARTIGLLTWGMLTGKVLTGEATDAALIELRPELAKRVATDTVAMIRRKRGELPDVQAFLAVIATGDALRKAEIEIARIQAELFDERRIERETVATERVAEREKFESERRAYVEKAAEIEQRLADDRAEFHRYKLEEEERIASGDRQLNVERLQFDQERLELGERNAELAATRAEVDRLKADEERRIQTAVSTAVIAAIAALPPAPAIDDELRYSAAGLGDGSPTNKARVWSAREPQAWEPAAEEVPVGRPRWMIPAIAASVLVVLITIAIVVNHRGALPGVGTVGKEAVVPTSPSNGAGRVPRGGFMSQSAGGNVVPRVGPPLAPTDTTRSAAVPPGTPRDSSASSALSIAATDSARQDSTARRERALRERELRRARQRDSLARLDSFRRRDTTGVRPDTTDSRDSTLHIGPTR